MNLRNLRPDGAAMFGMCLGAWALLLIYLWGGR